MNNKNFILLLKRNVKSMQLTIKLLHSELSKINPSKPISVIHLLARSWITVLFRYSWLIFNIWNLCKSNYNTFVFLLHWYINHFSWPLSFHSTVLPSKISNHMLKTLFQKVFLSPKIISYFTVIYTMKIYVILHTWYSTFLTLKPF
jgi:hypothetical protein